MPPTLPIWARAIDALAVCLFAFALWIALVGGFSLDAGGIALSVASPWRVLFVAVALLTARHFFVRRRPIHERIAAAGQTRAGRFVPLNIVALFAGLTVVMTWPQVLVLSSDVSAHDDSFFNIWRLASIARHLWNNPADLFEGNIFYPAVRTLGYSDPVLLQGLLATPLLWLGANQILVYNLLVLASFLLSALGAFLLVRHLTGQTAAGIVAGIVYGFGFYRIDHYMHLELLWGQWMPIALLALHRTIERGRLKDGLYTGGFIALQTLSSIYYTIFFVTTLALTAPLLFLRRPRAVSLKAVGALSAGALIAVAVALTYAQPLVANRPVTGDRSTDDVRTFSATPESYLASPETSVLYGWTALEYGGQETNLFPGVIAFVLTILGAWPLDRVRAMYLTMLVFAVLATLGLNGPLYPLLYDWLEPYRSLRVPARFGVLVLLATSVLAGFGFAKVMTWLSSVQMRRVVAATAAILLSLEFLAPPALMSVPPGVPSAYRWLREQPAAVVVELPMPLPFSVPRDDAKYQYMSTFHWRPLLNGYSGYYPQEYWRMLEAIRRFPEGPWVDELLDRGAHYFIVHERFLTPAQYASALVELEMRRDVQRMGQFEDGWGRVQIYRAMNQSGAQADGGAPGSHGPR